MLHHDRFWSVAGTIWGRHAGKAPVMGPGARAKAAEIRRCEERTVLKAAIGLASR